MGDISKNFSWDEVTGSDAADSKGIDNSIPEELKCNAVRLIEKVLQPSRDAVGEVINCNSFYRCEELNKAVGGVKTSHHTKGMACDVTMGEVYKNDILFEWMKGNLEFTQLIKYGNFIHVSYDPNNLKGQVIYK